ncbi:MAG TPA: MMPL family transporter [Solirubrobacterales bacterium]|nr:MMPL family transporter [Solirubrobacterales bacterium]
MSRLAGFLGRRRRWVLAGWAIVLLLALPFAARQTEHLTGGGFDVPGSQSKAVSNSLQSEFGGDSNGIAVLLKASPSAGPAAQAASVGRVRHAVAGVVDVTLPASTARRAAAELRGRGIAMLPLSSNLTSDELIDSAGELREELDPGTPRGGVTTYLAGQPTIWAGMQELSKKDLSEAEAGGFPIVAIILLVVFGSLAAAVLPLALGFVSVMVTGALIYFISLHTNTSVFVTNMASMIGIGVAIDYSLFILARYREERAAGRSSDDARAEALSTSGLAVTFSGLAVIVSLAGLWMVDNQALRSMALGAMTVVAVSILAATTLLPALIAMLGDRVLPGGVVARVLRLIRRPFRGRPAATGRGSEGQSISDSSGLRGSGGSGGGFWVRWTTTIMARPWTAVLSVSAVLLFLAIPVLSIATGTQAITQFPKGDDVRVGNELASQQLGGGTDPVQVVASFDDGASAAAKRAATAAFVRTLQSTPGVASVAPPSFAQDSVLIQATPSAPSESDAAIGLVERLRDPIAPSSGLARIASVDVGGETARGRDVRELISGSMWKIVLFVLALSFLVLMAMLRSLLLPLKAVLMNLLSIGAAFGVLVAIFQWGWFDGLLGVESQGALDTINVPLIFAVVFGLSMDYEVFLMSRIREHYMEHGDNERAVAEGLSTSARTISSAALIMTCVFAVFVLTGVPSIKELGLGCAVAIALDATLVRLILVPAAMKLLGDWNWWMPSWLDRLLPDFAFESGSGDPEPAKA